jgi:hypothetical protein
LLHERPAGIEQSRRSALVISRRRVGHKVDSTSARLTVVLRSGHRGAYR